jgi:hypothetical protein
VLASVLAAVLAACRGGRTPPPQGGVPAGPPVSPSEARLVSDAPAPRPRVPVPAPTPGEAKSLDELLAVVEGDVITRKRIAKLIGERTPDESEAEYEQKIYRKLLERANTSVVVKAATRMGLSAPPDLLDAFVVRASKREVDAARAKAEKAKPGSGATITFERILAERGQTMEDYRAERTDEMLVGNYFHVLVNGVPGKRAQLDLEASPGDIRRLYDAHRARFDVQPGVRYVFWIAKPTDYFGRENRTYDQAKELAVRALEGAIADHRRGEPAGEVARKHGIGEESWRELPKGRWHERGIFTMKGGPEVEEWLFDAARKPGDARVFAFDDPLGMVVVEVRPGRPRTFEEVEPELAQLILDVREKRFRLTHTLELLGRATVQSRLPVLDDLQAAARADLRRLDENEVTRDVRLR